MPSLNKNNILLYKKKASNWGTRSFSGNGFYQSPEWKRLRKSYIKANPFDEMELKKGRYVIGQVVDHITPISQGGEPLEWSNLQTLSIKNHSIKTAKERNRKGGRVLKV